MQGLCINSNDFNSMAQNLLSCLESYDNYFAYVYSYFWQLLCILLCYKIPIADISLHVCLDYSVYLCIKIHIPHRIIIQIYDVFNTIFIFFFASICDCNPKNLELINWKLSTCKNFQTKPNGFVMPCYVNRHNFFQFYYVFQL